MSTWGDDVRLSLCGLRKAPGFTATAVLALTLGIGLTTIMVSIANGTVSRAPVFAEADRLMLVRTNLLSQGIERRGVPVEDLRDWQAQQASFENLAAYRGTTVDASQDQEGEPERLDGAFVTANLFRLLRVQPFAGRAFLPEENLPGAPQVAVLAHDLWMRRYGGDPGVLGATIRVDREPVTIVGIMPPEARFPAGTDIWLPLRLAPAASRGEGPLLGVVGRLRDGVSQRRAQADMSLIARRLEAAYPESNKGVGVVVVAYGQELRGTRGTVLSLILLAAVCLVLLIACSNVANLLFARVLSRSKEIAIRSAIGAGRGRLIRPFLVESLLLSISGAIPGILLAMLGVNLFNKLILPSDQPLWGEARLDSTALLSSVAIMLAASVISGLAPALYAARVDAGSALKDETHGMSGLRLGRLSRWIVVTEVGLSYILLVAAAIIVRTAFSWATVDIGFSTDDVLTAMVQLREQAYPDDTSRTAFAEELQRRLETTPGVRSAAVTDILPATSSAERLYEIDGRPGDAGGERRTVGVVTVTPGFFETFGVALRAGRDFDWRDDAGSPPVAIVNQSFANREWPGESPLGRRFRFAEEPGKEAAWVTVIGVAQDMYLKGLTSETQEGLFVPLAQENQEYMIVAVRAAADPLALVPVVRQQVAAVDKDLPIFQVKVMRQILDEDLYVSYVVSTLFAVFGVVGLALAAVGLFGVTAFIVRRRTTELGVRMALGARSKDVLLLTLRQGMRPVMIGMAGGLLLAVAIARLLALVGFKVDFLTFLAVALVVAGVGAFACLAPALRAARVDPLVALRSG